VVAWAGMPVSFPLRLLALGAGLAFVACGGSGAADAGTGGSASGGSASGGSASGGSASGGSASGGSASGGASTGGAESGGSSGTGGSGTGGSGTGGSGTGGSVSQSCPSAPPDAGVAPCSLPGQYCFYQDCAGPGIVSAFCDGGMYQVEVAQCQEFECGGETCTAGQICNVNAGGAYIGTCAENPCGDGPVTCACADPLCGESQCTVFAASGEGGIQTTCNTCPNGQACP